MRLLPAGVSEVPLERELPNGRELGLAADTAFRQVGKDERIVLRVVNRSIARDCQVLAEGDAPCRILGCSDGPGQVHLRDECATLDHALHRGRQVLVLRRVRTTEHEDRPWSAKEGFRRPDHVAGVGREIPFKRHPPARLP